jgi:hypothetical protein
MAWRMSEAEYEALTARLSGQGVPQKAPPAIDPRSKGRKAGWLEIGGKRHYFRSAWERNIARYAEWLKQNGQIVDWTYEATTHKFEGVKRGIVSYKEDFRITENSGDRPIWEVKGFMSRESKTKLNRMAEHHPHIRIVLIGKVQYQAIAATMRGTIIGWE